MSRDYRLRLRDIQEAAERVMRYCSGVTYEQFAQDSMRIDAVVRNLEVLSEAARALPARVLKLMPQQPWAEIKGFRNVIAHEYFRVDVRIVWETAARDIPALLTDVKRVLTQLREEAR